jgi:aspartyl-tRNA(Asn)/glutamyl-tRNA(Gln) amidotransferase subunit C
VSQSSPAISRDEVARLAKLARLALTDDEIDSFAGQLDAILGYVGQIQAIDTSGVKPTGNPLKSENVTRSDVVQGSLSQQQALAEAPAADEGRFAVPQILGEEA